MKRFAKLTLVSLILLTGFVLLRGTAPQVATGTWQSGSDMNEARTGAAAVTLDDGRVLVFGGTTSSGGATNAVQVFSDGSWSDLGAVMLDARSGHTVTKLAYGYFLIAGGENSSGPLSSLELYDSWYNEFISADSLSGARKSHGAALLPDGRVLLIGGSDGTNALASSEIYDLYSNSLSPGPPLPAPRSGLSATTLLDGKVLIAGGSNGEAADLASTLIYNPTDGSLSAGADLSTARSGHTAVLLPFNGSVLIAGGSGSSADLYTPWLGSVSATASMSAARNGAASSGSGWDGVAIVAGGSGSASSELYGFATAKTDRDDYIPGMTVVVTGGGWQPGETVSMVLHEVPDVHDDRILTAVADSNGNIFNDEFVTQPHHFGVTFYLTSVGQTSSISVQHRFSDARQFTAGISPTTATAGVATSYTLTVTNTSAGSPTGNIGCVEVAIPSGVTSVGSLSRTATDPGGVDRSSGWSAAAVSGSNIRTFRSASGPGAGDFDINPTTGTITISFTATSTSGTKTWTTGATSGGSATSCTGSTFAIVGAQPSVAVTAANVAPTVAANNASVTVSEGSLASNTGTYSDGNAGDNVSITASVGTVTKTGTNSGTWSWSFTPADGPTDSRTVTITANDGVAPPVNTTFALTVNNVAPTITNVTNNGPINEGSSALITVSATDPAGVNDPLAYQFDCNNDLTYEVGPQAGNTHSCSFADNGSFTVNVRVSDGDGGSDTDSTTVTVNNVNPTVTLSGAASANEGSTESYTFTTNDPGDETFTLDASSCGANGTMSNDSFNPADGSGSFDCTFPDGPNSSTVSVTVFDDDGGSDSDSIVVTINNVAPTVTLTGANAADEGDTRNYTFTTSDPGDETFTLDASSCGSNGTMSNDSFNSADGSGSFDCTFSDGDASSTVSVEVSDGDASDSDSKVVTISNVAPTISVSGASNVDEGSSYTVTLGNVVDPGNDSVTDYSINWGDGDTDNFSGSPDGAMKSHTYDDGPNNYSISVSLIDEDGTFNNAGTHSVTVDNVPPSATFSDDGPVNEGSSFNLSLTSPSDPSTADTAAGFMYAFDCGDGSGYNAYSGTASRSCPTTDNGVRSVKGKIKDKDDGEREYTASVTVNNVAPSVDTPVVTPEPSDEAASASASATFSDPGADTHTCTVDFGDGHTELGVVTETVGNPTTGSCSASHTYEDDSGSGIFTVQVSVIDDEGDTGTGSVAHDVNNLPPSISAVGNDGPVNEGSPATITVTATDPAGPVADPLSYEFDCDNDSTYEVGPQASNQGQCTFPDNGLFTVGVRVDDGDGGTDTDTTVVTVLNVAPAGVSVTPSPSTLNEDDSTSLSGSFTDPGTADTHTVVISWGDGSPNTTVPLGAGVLSFSGVSHQYKDDNPTATPSDVNSISVTVTDDDLDSGGGGSSVTVNNLAPVLTINSPANGTTFIVGGTVNMSSSFTDVGTQDTHTCSINWGDGSPLAAGTVVEASGSGTCTGSHIYSTVGSKTISATLTDDDTGYDAESVTLSIQYTFIGFLPPIDNLPIINNANAGRVIPIKWQLKDANGNLISDLGSMVSLLAYNSPCDASIQDIIEEELTAPGATVFRYDGTQFIYNWQTSKTWKGKCFLLQVTLLDGTKHYAKFSFR